MENPRVSVVILSRNPPAELIDQLNAQTYKNFEIVSASEKGIVHAMNSALSRARGEILVRIDDDVELPKDWLEELIRPFDDPLVGGVTGPTFVPKERRGYRDSIKWAENPTGLLKWLYDGNTFNPGGIRECGCVSYDSNYQERFHDFWESETDRLEGTNWAVRKKLLTWVGGFDYAYDGVCEWHDDDAHAKIRKLGYMFVYNPNAYLYHLLEKGEHFNDRFEGFGRIKNHLRFHWRHGRHRFLNIKFYVYLLLWGGYFVWLRFRR